MLKTPVSVPLYTLEQIARLVDSGKLESGL